MKHVLSVSFLITLTEGQNFLNWKNDRKQLAVNDLKQEGRGLFQDSITTYA
jgi:hypothetical protein